VDYNWLTPKALAQPAGDKGWGSFVTERISVGETVAGFGGWMVPRDFLSTLSADRQARSIQVDEDLYLVSSDVREPGDMLNHSCDPNCHLQVHGGWDAASLGFDSLRGCPPPFYRVV
jgi:hypothetical protein